MNTPTPLGFRCTSPDCKPLGRCPWCGANEAGDWVDGYHGWTCGSICTDAHNPDRKQLPPSRNQSKECYARQVTANLAFELAEALRERDQLKADLATWQKTWQKKYYDVADAITRESTGTEGA